MGQPVVASGMAIALYPGMPARVLVVTTDAMASMMLEGVLPCFGHHVEVVRRLDAAERKLANTDYDLVLLDDEVEDGDTLLWLVDRRIRDRTLSAAFLSNFSSTLRAPVAGSRRALLLPAILGRIDRVIRPDDGPTRRPCPTMRLEHGR
jgi:CheY-like chemotaxis protein